jgi:VWFA-related protein
MGFRDARVAAGWLALVCGLASGARAQGAPTPTPAEPGGEQQQQRQQQQETVRVFTEEVLLPVRVTDEHGRFDPSLERSELLVLEDGVPQEITSARHLPASVLVVVSTAGELNPAMKTSATREAAARLVSQLRAGDRVSVVQYGTEVETVQGWTEDRVGAVRAIHTYLSSKRGARLAAALRASVARLEETPAGNRHLVLITDGVDDSKDGGESVKRAVASLLATGTTVHVIGYTRMGRRAVRKASPPVIVSGKKPRKTANDIAAEIMNPIKAESKAEMPDLYVTLDLDVWMRRRRGAYERAMREGEGWLRALAEETGGRLSLPLTLDEMLADCASVARDIDTQYVVAYKPKRPLSTAERDEYRRVEVVARRIGLSVSARRGYVVPSALKGR